MEFSAYLWEAMPQVMSAAIPGFTLTIFSEIGDKTFLIAAIMSIKFSSYLVFFGATSALLVMTILSAFAGVFLPHVMSKGFAKTISIVLFLFFGCKIIVEAYSKKYEETGKEEEVGALVGISRPSNMKKRRNHNVETGFSEFSSYKSSKNLSSNGLKTSLGLEGHINGLIEQFFCLMGFIQSSSPVFWRAFTMVFFAEWGDRSQISTVALAAAHNVLGVILGTFLAQFLCTLLAVLGGKLIAKRLPERLISIIGGLFFFVFALLSYLDMKDETLQHH